MTNNSYIIKILRGIVSDNASDRLEAKAGEEVIKKVRPKLVRGLSVRQSIDEALDEIKGRMVYPTS